MRMAKTALILLASLFLGACVKTYIVGHTDDWSDYFIGEGDADPIAGRGSANIEFQKAKLKCTGSFVDYKKVFGAVGTRTRGELVCNDGRKITTDSIVLSLSHGSGTGLDSHGFSGEFAFYTDEASYEADLAKTAKEVARRDLSVDHLLAGKNNPAAATAQVRQNAGEIPEENLPQAAPPPVAASTPPATPAPPIGSDRKLALIIGNAAYPDAALRNPVNDARAIAGKLRSLGFDILLGENLKQRDMTRLITGFGEKLAGKNVGVFYYAGHGLQIKGRNFLLPVDAQISSEASARSESIDLDQVLEHLGSSGSQVNLVILDACRNNPFERRFRGSAGGLAQVEAPKGTLIAFATSPGKVAQDGEGKNGTYTTALLKTLSEPGLTVESVFKRVRGEVAKATGDQQIPWESSSLTGEFYFIPPAPVAAGEDAAKVSATELLFWQSIKDSNDADDFRAYLKRYPNGQFSDIARNRVKKLGK